MRSIGHHLLHHIFNLGKLVHQAHLVMKTPGRIDNHHIGLIGHGRTERVESHRSGVGTHLLLHHGNPHALAPNHQLLHGSRAESIRRTQVNRFAGLLELVGQLSDGSGLAHPIDTYHHDHVGPLGNRSLKLGHITRIVLGQQGGYLIAQDAVQLLRVHIFVGRDTLLNALDDFQGGLHAYIRRNQHLFQVVQHLVIHLGLSRYGTGNLSKHAFLRLGQAFV